MEPGHEQAHAITRNILLSALKDLKLDQFLINSHERLYHFNYFQFYSEKNCSFGFYTKKMINVNLY